MAKYEPIEWLAWAATHAVHALIGVGAWIALIVRFLPLRLDYPDLFYWAGAGLFALLFGVFGPFLYRWYSPDHRSRGSLAEVKAKSRRRR